MTLEKILQSQGFGSRKCCREMVLDDRVTVNGIPCTEPSTEFDTDGLAFTVGGHAWCYRPHVYLAMHKPAGYECSHQTQHHPSVFSLLPPQLVMRGVQCVGRLDQDTTGLLLMSDDGAFIHTYSSPKKKVGKTYEVTAKHPVQPAQVAALLDGVLLHDETAPLAASACEQIDPVTLHLTIAEGKYHQVKRMVAAAGNRVEKLHRIAIGSFRLGDDLPIGTWKWLEVEDLARLGYTLSNGIGS
jgi:16S rRNA pseudouridine516 synthase